MSPKLSPREELIRIQRMLVERYRDDIERTLEDSSGLLKVYQQEHDAEVESYERISGKAELISEVINAGLVYVGDFHSLRASQTTFLKLIRETVRIRPKICLALEAFNASDQHHLDAYLKRRIKFTTLLRRVDFDRTWGFGADVYESILGLARERGLPVVGINHKVGGRHALVKRDEGAARIIARLSSEHPEHIVFVLDGELHVADCHLPSRVRALLASQGIERRRLILYQNPEQIYWLIAERKLEQVADVVRLADYRYALLSSTPLVMYQSYLNWLYDQQELVQGTHPGWTDGDSVDYNSQVHDLVQIIAEFLGITEVALDNFSVYCVSDLDFLESMISEGFNREQIAQIKQQILKRESYFIVGRNIIYLASLSVDHAAEESTHYINARCAGLDQREHSAREDFYQRVMREALGFFGSMVINPKRQFYDIDDFTEMLSTRAEPTEERNRELYRISRYVLLHKEYEREYLAGRRRATKRYSAIWSQPFDIHLGTAHGLGYMLGERMFQSVGWGIIERSEVKRLFFDDFKRRGSAQRAYMDLVARLIDAPSARTF
ncbi:MAG: ChaN family lipoprotein [Candidatus Alcyoniella australis]|nr:ChaN family lipoprotein [Candidatus Alcyoniella australis]